jgi:class 3 adenylate cyclase
LHSAPHRRDERIYDEQSGLSVQNLTSDERKIVTALFADLKGSTALIEGLDPEEARALIDPALQLMMEAIHRYEGYVAQALGDGIFALFGAPVAHEDHPQRAVYAALRMQDDMRRYSNEVSLTHGVSLDMRVCVNTGEVLMRSIYKDELRTDHVPSDTRRTCRTDGADGNAGIDLHHRTHQEIDRALFRGQAVRSRPDQRRGGSTQCV